LVAQGLQRRRVEHLRALAQRPEDGVLGDDRLAARRRGADQDAASSRVELLDRLALERVEVEGQRLLELLDQGGRLHSWTSSVDTSVMIAPSQCASMKDSAAASTRSA